MESDREEERRQKAGSRDTRNKSPHLCENSRGERQVRDMGKLLEQLYAGELQPCERVSHDNEEYKVLCKESLEEIEHFSRKLDVDLREEFDGMMEHYLELTYMEKAQTFGDGFRIGARLMCEVFYENNREEA